MARRSILVAALVSLVLPLSLTAEPVHAQSALERLEGGDRYRTAVAISRQYDDPGTVYLASGEAYPDALAGSPAAASAEGPILLSKSDTLPRSTAERLAEIDPTEIVVLGGEQAISEELVEELAVELPDAEITRIHGQDRFASAAAVSRESFADGAQTVFVASGDGFPDALTAGPLASTADGPILLVKRKLIPSVVREELQRLAPERIVMVGGESVLTGALEGELENYAPSVQRIAGADRYGTSTEVSRSIEGDPGLVFVATGADFPDALAVGPLAGMLGAPVLLTQKDNVPKVVREELLSNEPARIVVLGSTGAVSKAAAKILVDPAHTEKLAEPELPVRKVVKYRVVTAGNLNTSVSTFKKQVQQTLDDPRGWRAAGVKFEPVTSGGQMTVVLAEASRVPGYAPSVCSANWSCQVGNSVIINQDRWKFASPAWNAAGGVKRDYRHMVVNHEVGHWLGHGHRTCSGMGKKAAVMQQQSISLGGCTFNPWPLGSELYTPRF